MFILYAVLFIITVALIANMIFVTAMGWELYGKSKVRLALDILLIVFLLTFSVSYLDQAIDEKTHNMSVSEDK